MNIKYRFMEAGITQSTLAGMIENKLRSRDNTWCCNQCNVSTVFGKVSRGDRLTEREQAVYNIALDILEDLENGKTEEKDH